MDYQTVNFFLADCYRYKLNRKAIWIINLLLVPTLFWTQEFVQHVIVSPFYVLI